MTPPAPAALPPEPVLGDLPEIPAVSFLGRVNAEEFHRWGKECFQQMARYHGELFLGKDLTRSVTQEGFRFRDHLHELGSQVLTIEWWRPKKRRAAMIAEITMLWDELGKYGHGIYVEQVRAMGKTTGGQPPTSP